MIIRNLMKSAFAAGILFSCSTSFAQEQVPQQAPPAQQQMQQQPMQKRPPEERADRQLRWMQPNLMLTQEQHEKVFRILVNIAREEDNANINMPQGPQKKEEKKEIRKDEFAELRTVLSPDQFQKYMAHVKEMKEKNRERKEGMPQGNY